jgi:hypothetical protein
MDSNDKSLAAVFAAAAQRERERARVGLHAAALALLKSSEVRS